MNKPALIRKVNTSLCRRPKEFCHVSQFYLQLPLVYRSSIRHADFPRGYLGRLDTNTGQVKEWPSPGGPKSEPYGISAIKDVIWYSESGTTPNTVVRFDPKTEQFQTWVIPGGGNIVRNTDVTLDGNFVLANSLVNAVSLVELK